ncbi:uncharacterized protein LOC109725873 [Ananas comosus]|uniref:Uncharacterized protein LOC109725873 n=1 Tax=Ananas comosus TaxID=4615 RepID=A0A6P5GYR8_ANACO|nr:uncharacterized protein LOC109725873 [Ananas comosus]
MDRYVVPAPQQNPRSPRSGRARWTRSAAEIEGRFGFDYRHEASRLLIDSYAEARAFEHNYNDGSNSCPTQLARIFNAANQDTPISSMREGISALEFDAKGVYLASVTKSGCLTVHDFETLYCTTYGPISRYLGEEAKHLLHISTSMPLDAVQWNPENQDEIACASRQNDKIVLFDIGYVTSDPVQVLEKGKSKFSRLNSELNNGLSDVVFASDGKSRLFGSGLDGAIYMWDRRQSNIHCLELTTLSQCQLNSIELDLENRVIFGASRHGIIYAWDLRGGRTSFAFQSHNEVPLLTSLKISSMLEKITSLKVQSNIVSSEIHSLNFDPSCPYQLAFHLDDGWSGVLNINTLTVTHMHCPPPAWLEGVDMSLCPSTRKPSWLPTCSVYAVGSLSGAGIYLLDFRPNTNSACHVDFDEEQESNSRGRRGTIQNKFVPASQNVVACAAHPLNGTIIAGTKHSSLLVLSQKRKGSP